MISHSPEKIIPEKGLGAWGKGKRDVSRCPFPRITKFLFIPVKKTKGSRKLAACGTLAVSLHFIAYAKCSMTRAATEAAVKPYFSARTLQGADSPK